MCNHRKLCIATRFAICDNNLRVKNDVFWNYSAVSHKTFVCCTLTIRYNIYSVVGRSIASISDLGGIFTSVLHASVNMASWVRYISNKPPYHTICITYYLYMIYVRSYLQTSRLPINIDESISGRTRLHVWCIMDDAMFSELQGTMYTSLTACLVSLQYRFQVFPKC